MVFNQFSMVFGGIARFALEGSRAGKLRVCRPWD